jgi:hypothetical protein
MARREDTIPADLLDHFIKTVPGFRDQTKPVQMALTRLAWSGTDKRRAHCYFEGFSTFHYLELWEEFGRGKFDGVNRATGFFDVTPNWHYERKQTKGYKLSPLVQRSMDEYLHTRWRKPAALLYGDGLTLRTLPKAVASKDMGGITTKAWRNARKLNKTRVNLDELGKLRKLLEERLKDLNAGRIQMSLFHTWEDPQRIQRALDVIAKINRMARTDVVGHGYVSHRYVESQSGRLYAKGMNLQTVPTLIKQVALQGLWEYDFHNCHYAILAQMADRSGIPCEAMKHYLENKSGLRKHIAEAAGISIEQTKMCLLAIMYGARLAERPENAIPEEIGQDAAQRLYGVTEFTRIYDDIKRVRRAVLKAWPTSGNGWMKNDFGKGIRVTVSPEKRLAHLIQGVEAKALAAVIEVYPDDIVLLQHDGFAAHRRLDVGVIEAAVWESTGYRLAVEESRIQADLDRYFSTQRIQNEKPQNRLNSPQFAHPRVS